MSKDSNNLNPLIHPLISKCEKFKVLLKPLPYLFFININDLLTDFKMSKKSDPYLIPYN